AYNHFASAYFSGRGWEKVKPRTRIYDISNAIYETVNGTFFKLREFNIPIADIDSGPGFPKEKVLRDFRKLILSHCCTFKRKMYYPSDDEEKKDEPIDTHFVEEYVLPQLLTEVVRLYNYNGIIYPSTKFVDKKITIGGGWKSIIYATNLAMFTEYKPVNGKPPMIDNDLFTVLQVDTLDFKDLTKAKFKGKKLSHLDIKKMAEQMIENIGKFQQF